MPEPEEPMMASTSPRARVRSIPRRTLRSPKDLWMPRILSIVSLVSVSAIVRLQFFESIGEYSGHGKVEDACNEKGGHVKLALDDGARDTQEVVHGEDIDEGCVLDEVDGLVADGRQGDAQYLRQDDAAHGERAAHAEDARCLKLTARHCLYARTEDLGEVGSVVEDEGKQCCRDVGEQDADHRQGKVDKEQLQHERRAAHDPDVDFEDAAERPKVRKPSERDKEPQRQGKRERDTENLEGDA